MCLAVPAQIISVQEDQAVADLHGSRVKVCTVLVPGVAVGQWVLMHAGFAIQILDASALKETFAVLEDLSVADQSAGGGHDR